ncbi:hypothetical protein BU26DRAFT_94717 [Trematosphaeria pertusa]|uniref:Uncharacterized protein n=1 Tax=Trematosphaeria pertusa TaxID=390896 RepID=A0A6A6I1I3_9PLEO|nr:uncharacterized protein BU26DRAFT_94717 [Trematosphaeria pertusa]KAF2244136.1 hypothetical protein BU26DRAFT_94717 [Trematosphaeria pertusa]
MNRFLTRKKDKKKAQPEPKPELDLSAALPKIDDFRTSLIMPGLSTRFSMLREQDDPSSKIGKASDDSVLQPKRQSRLHEFGFVPGGLSDIAEVSSLNGSIRPPFATERQNSFDSHNTDDGSGSMMSRARPGEGNILFGGRQKIYKISGSGSSKGRALYEDDVNLSTFQKLRQQEKERLAAQEAQEQQGTVYEPSSPAKDTYSPSTEGFSRRRETSSSTNSGTNARTSTAATSIASQGANSVAGSSPALNNSAQPTSPVELNRSTTKARRLYDQGLDQHIYDQQSSALNRLNSIQRTRAPTGRSTPPLLFSQTRSATNLNDRFNRGPVFRTESPTALGNPGIPNGKDAQSSGSSPIISRPQSPPLTSPLASDSEDGQMLNSALQPQDRGKATAMGAFNKPKQAFSEERYAERLKQLQQERDASVPKLDNPRKPSLRERAELEKRKRAETAATDRQRSESTSEQKHAPSPFSVFQSAANQMKSSPTTATHPPRPQPEPSTMNVQSPDSQQGATFFASPGSSDDEEEAPQPVLPKIPERGRRIENLPTATGPAPPILDHPALRSRSNSRLPDKFDHPPLPSRSPSRPRQDEPRSSPQADPAGKPDDADIDSPTLGPNNGGLSGLIRQHLRNVSNVSSDYGDNRQSIMSPPPLQTQNFGLQRRQPTSETDTPAHSSYSHSNPWDLDDIESNPFYNERGSVSSVSPVDAPKPKPQPINDKPLWEKEEEKTHQRGDSVEEHEAFQRDLVQRQRAIQESLRARAEGRSTSPAPTSSGGLKTALSMLRAKSSRESFATVDAHRQQEAPSKAMKMLGIGANSANGSSTSLAGDHWRPEGQSLRQKPMRMLQQSERDAQREREESRQRSATNDSSRDPRPQGRSPPSSSRASTRDRSNSEVSSGRSRSRPGQYRDDLEQAMAEGVGSRTTMYPPNSSPSLPGYAANTTQPLPAERPSLDSQGRLRSRSNSRTAASNYFESKHLQPIHTGHGPVNGASPRLSPAGHSPQPPQFSPGLPASPRPSPGNPSPSLNAFRPQASPVPPFSANNTPPVSNPGTPVAPAFNPNAAPQPMAKIGTLRKKSIAKSDISEPVFVSTTSVIDTINLPPGASLKNGIQTPPPVPPINPKRRRFGLGRSEYHDPGIHPGLGAPHAPFADPMRTNSSDALSSQTQLPRQRLRQTSSEGKSLHGTAQAQAGASPATPTTPFGRNNSPPRPIHVNPNPQRNMNGAMF